MKSDPWETYDILMGVFLALGALGVLVVLLLNRRAKKNDDE